MTVREAKLYLENARIDFTSVEQGIEAQSVADLAIKALDLLEKQEAGLIYTADDFMLIADALLLKKRQEQGLLIELPVPLGTEVYAIVIKWGEISYDYEVAPIRFDEAHLFCLGHTVFATREEAEKQLKELRGEE